MKLTTTWSLLVNFCWFHSEISQQYQHGIIISLLPTTALELPENRSAPEITTDLKSHGQLKSTDFHNLNHFIQQGSWSPRRVTNSGPCSHWYGVTTPLLSAKSVKSRKHSMKNKNFSEKWFRVLTAFRKDKEPFHKWGGTNMTQSVNSICIRTMTNQICMDNQRETSSHLLLLGDNFHCRITALQAATTQLS